MSPVSASVAVIGLGNLGSALAGALIEAGCEVTVCNRTAAKADPLVARGATRAESFGKALSSAQLIAVCLVRYSQLRDGFGKTGPPDLIGKTIVNLGWGSPEEAEELGEWVTSLGGDYLDGGVPVSPSQIGLPDTELVYSGSRSAWERWGGVLAALGGASQWLGEGFGEANIVSLAIPGTYYQVAYGVFLEGVAYASARGVSPLALRSITRSSSRMLATDVEEALDRIEAESFSTDQATIDIVLDSLLAVRDAMDTAGQRATLVRAMIDVLERGTAAGRGDDGCAAVFPLLRDGG